MIPYESLRTEQEYWKTQLEVIADLVYEALEKGDMSLFQNLQAFATTIALKSIIPRVILRALIQLTIEERTERRNLLEALKTDPNVAQEFVQKYPTKEERDTVKARLSSDEVIIDIEEFLQKECTDLNKNRCRFFLNGLNEKGIISFYGSGSYSAPRAMSLPPRLWGFVIRRIESELKEIDFFTDCMGKLLGMAIFKEGVQSFKPLALIIQTARENGVGDLVISEEERIRCYAHCGVPSGRARTMEAGDAVKVEEIRFYKSTDGKTWVIPKERKLVYELIRRRAVELLRRRGVRI
jgi:hypothetical protein